MGRNVQISIELFESLCKFHLQNHTLEEWELQELWGSIEHQLQRKVESMQRRESYTQYKTGETADQREVARQQYLDQRGVPKSYRWSQQYEDQRKK